MPNRVSKRYWNSRFRLEMKKEFAKVRMFLCLSVYLFIYLFVCYVCLFVCLSVYLFVYVYLFICLFCYRLFLCLSVYLSVCLFVCLFFGFLCVPLLFPMVICVFQKPKFLNWPSTLFLVVVKKCFRSTLRMTNLAGNVPYHGNNTRTLSTE